jgi:hypothetical protein
LKKTGEPIEQNKDIPISNDEFESIGVNEEIQVIYNTCLNESMVNGKIGDHDNMQCDIKLAKKLLKFLNYFLVGLLL